MNNLLIITKNVETNAGIGRYSFEVVRALFEQGYVATILVERNSVCNAVPNEISIHAVLYPPHSFFSLFRNIIISRRYARKYKMVHALDGWPFAIYGYAAVVGSSKRLFISALGSYAVAPLSYIAKRLLLVRAYRRAQRIFCISAYTQSRLLKIVSLTNTNVVPLATSTLKILSKSDADEIVRHYGIVAQTPVFLTVGQIKERKGQLDTLKALNLLKRHHPNFLYVMIGSGEEKGYIGLIHAYMKEQRLQKNVLLIMDSRDDSVPAFFYSRCDVFLLNANSEKSHFEGFGLVILEAAQYGRPSIGSRGSGIEDAIKDGYNGFLTGQKEYQEIAAKIEIILKDYARFSENAREFASRFSWRNTVDNYILDYNSSL